MNMKLIKSTFAAVILCFAAHTHGAGIAGLDLSEHNRLIDGKAVIEQNYLFAFVEALHGRHKDQAFKDNWLRARQVGLPVGAYLYLLPNDDIEVQTRMFIAHVQATNKEVNAILKQPSGKFLPFVVDLEDAPRWKRSLPNPAQRVAKILACLKLIKAQLGTDPIVYMSPSFSEEVLSNAVEFARYDLWVAQYKVSAPKVPKPWTTWRFWQWKNTGTVRGVTGRNDRDFDYFNGSLGNLHSLMCAMR